MHLKFRGRPLGFVNCRLSRIVFPSSFNELLDLKNVGLAAGISLISCLLSCVEAEMHTFEV